VEGRVITDAAEQIAATMIQKTFDHLPPVRAAGAIALANLEPLRDALAVLLLEGYDRGLRAGIERGRFELAREMEDDWRPIAERVRGSAGMPNRAELEAARDVPPVDPDYTGGPVPAW
jgi:hypothetical protein